MRKIIKFLPILVLLFMATVSVVKIYAYEKNYNEKMTIIYDNACVQIYEDEVSLLFNDIATNNVNTLHIILMFISTVIIIVLTFKIIVKQYKSEKILFSN